jgi:small subunit ribosomal protein S6
MRRYETILLAQPSLSEEERQPLLDKLATLISDGHGLLVKVDDWGQRRLAYEINKQTRAYYSLIDFCGDGALVKELERIIRLDDRALKYMTVCVEQEVDVEGVKAEIEAAAEEASPPSPKQEGPAPEAPEEPPPPEASEPSGEAEKPDDTAPSSEQEGPTHGSV